MVGHPEGGARWLWLFLLAGGISLPLLAAGPEDYELLSRTLSDGRTLEEKAWVEIEPDLPASPDVSSLVRIDVGSTSSNRFEIDASSVTVAADEVIRYIIVITSPGGARNVSFEGMRCATAERRLYALGRADGSWAKARTSRWQPILENSLNRHHAALFRDYFCTTGGSVSNTAEARRVLATGNPAATVR